MVASLSNRKGSLKENYQYDAFGNDPEIVEDIIKRINAFGEKRVKMAFNIVAKKRPYNPKRNYPYVKGIINRYELNK